MNIEQTVDRLRGIFQAKRVYAEAVERDGVTVIPAAMVVGGGGAGGGESPDGNTGGGTGFGLVARPVGAWVIHRGGAEWKPAASLERERALLAVPLLVLLLALIWVFRRRD